jgi:hypothetical protein
VEGVVRKYLLNTLSGPDSRDLSVRDPADRIRVSAWSCQTLSEVSACYLGITRRRVRTFYLPVLPLYGFTKLYTNPFLIIYLLPNFKLPVLVLFLGFEAKKTKFVFPQQVVAKAELFDEKVEIGSKPSRTRIAMILTDYSEKLERVLGDMRVVVNKVSDLLRQPVRQDLVASSSKGLPTLLSQHRIEYFPTMFQILL